MDSTPCHISSMVCSTMATSMDPVFGTATIHTRVLLSKQKTASSGTSTMLYHGILIYKYDGWQEDRCLALLVQPGPSQWGMCMALSLGKPDESRDMLRCLAGYEDGTVALWDVTPNQGCPMPQSLKAHTESVMAVSFDSILQGAPFCPWFHFLKHIPLSPSSSFVGECMQGRHAGGWPCMHSHRQKERRRKGGCA